ncbi:hypothetical protein E2C01_099307 [Portunus trituberculatus]|uniref:Uncharacterized protein n=1 Tax=Portunus trituberculatus TaxID=210409 RepID=A0A5B7K009_PORTR|nr:hypothetical protein [Portunus trituberculatus]
MAAPTQANSGMMWGSTHGRAAVSLLRDYACMQLITHRRATPGKLHRTDHDPTPRSHRHLTTHVLIYEYTTTTTTTIYEPIFQLNFSATRSGKVLAPCVSSSLRMYNSCYIPQSFASVTFSHSPVSVSPSPCLPTSALVTQPQGVQNIERVQYFIV